MGRRAWLVVAALTAGVQVAYGPDWISFARWGIFPIVRPQATPRPVLGVYSDRFDDGAGIELAVSLQGVYPTTHSSAYPVVMKSSAYRYRVHATIETISGEAVPLGCRWRWLGGSERGCVTTLPPLPDGEHRLRISVDSAMPSEASMVVPLPYYAPASTHLLTDRPTYSAGDTLLARALTYARADLRPVASRPGTWTLTRRSDRAVLFQEEATADDWGVSAMSLILPETLPDGGYTLRWESGDAIAEQPIQIEDVEMPWLLVDAVPTQGWFTLGEAPAFSGTVQTADGRPAANTEITTSVSVTGGWPPPTAWAEPQALRTDQDGHFQVVFSEIPPDLRRRETLVVNLQAQDQTGTISTGTVTVPISPDTLEVSAVTGTGGLLESRSNRVYLRLTTPDGRPLVGETATIESAIDARDTGREATTDADGVLMLQLDPGPAMAMVMPPSPVREEPARTDTFSLSEGRAVLEGRVLNLPERAAIAAVLPDLDRACGQLIDTAQTTTRLISASGGRISAVTPRTGALGACIADALRGRSWPAPEGLWEVSLSEAPDPTRPRLTLRFDEAAQAPSAIKSAMADAAARAGACVTDAEASIETLGYVRWHLAAEAEKPRLWFSPAVPACVKAAFSDIAVPEANADEQGAVWLALDVPRATPEAPPEPDVRRAWRYRVRVGDRVGYWTAWPSHNQNNAIRAERPILAVGEPLTIIPVSGWHTPEVMTLHGPGGWSQRCPRADVANPTAEISPNCPTRPAQGWRFQPPGDGFYWTRDHGTAFAYVRPEAPTILSISADKEVYSPGDVGKLSIETGSPAVVSLVGHDDRLARVLELPDPEDLQGATLPFPPQRTFGAFSLLDLVSGRVRGEAAALAILTEATTSSRDPYTEEFDYERFVDVLEPPTDAETAAAVAAVAFAVQQTLRTPPLGPLQYEDVARLWDEEVDRQGAVDAWGRPLRLSVVPSALVSKIDPRVLSGDATRFPEAVEPWTEWFVRSHQ